MGVRKLVIKKLTRLKLFADFFIKIKIKNQHTKSFTITSLIQVRNNILQQRGKTSYDNCTLMKYA